MRRSITVNFRYPFAPFSRTNQHLLGTLAKFSGLGRYFPTLTSVSIYQRPAVKSPENLPFSTPNLDLPRHGSIPMRHSGLQKDVLKLYRDLHRAARKKDPNDVDHFTSFVMRQFRIKAESVTKTDFKTIEHLLRYGYKQKKLIEMPGFRTGSVTSP